MTIVHPTQAVAEADCRDQMRTMAAASVACVVTSPPYNLAKPYASYDDNRPTDEYLADQGKVAELIARLLRQDGHLFLNVGSNSQHPWRSVQVAERYAAHLVLQQRIVWVKSIALDGSTLPEPLRSAMHDRQVGHFPSLNSDRFLNPVFEDVWHFTPEGRSSVARIAPGVGVPYVWADQPARFGHRRELHCRGNVWHIPYKTTQSRGDRDHHPSPFPVALAERCLRLAGLKPGDLVLDPFMGTGATLLAAQQLYLSAIGIEIDPGYCAAARRRLVQTGEGITP
jgi:site-specific DNA-methyltransferase (adenine-specific)